jgi:hypothetical protein
MLGVIMLSVLKYKDTQYKDKMNVLMLSVVSPRPWPNSIEHPQQAAKRGLQPPARFVPRKPSGGFGKSVDNLSRNGIEIGSSRDDLRNQPYTTLSREHLLKGKAQYS